MPDDIKIWIGIMEIKMVREDRNQGGDYAAP
jgi:hypothetical protein